VVTPFVREDFAGPGGWDEGARLLGLPGVIAGVEYAGPRDPSVAARVAVAAGHKRWVADVQSAAVRDYAWPSMSGYIASPPCQTFSTAGKGEGRAHLEALVSALSLVYDGETPEDAVAAVHDAKLDVRSVLVLEPMLVIRRHRPRWVAFEQVPGVLPIWQAYATLLRDLGYSVWTDTMTSERYGVPQTRNRAILIASLDREVGEPAATHSRYYSRDPGRIDPGVPQWVSMAEALTWGMTGRPYPTISVGTKAGGADSMALGGSRARQIVYNALEAGDWLRHPEGGARFNDQSGTPFDELWPEKRPATAVAGRGIVQNPGATANRFNRSTKSRNDGVRVTVREAGVLQSFRADYPWEAAGTRTAQYQRVGDAIPPLMARAILSEATGIPFDRVPVASS